MSLTAFLMKQTTQRLDETGRIIEEVRLDHSVLDNIKDDDFEMTNKVLDLVLKQANIQENMKAYSLEKMAAERKITEELEKLKSEFGDVEAIKNVEKHIHKLRYR